ncbi:hypothetical protein [Spirosoma jeollabukense]
MSRFRTLVNTFASPIFGILHTYQQAMYPSKPTFDYSFVHEDDMSVYGPKDHQRIISKLNTRLGMLYYVEGTIQLEPFPETMIDETRASRNDGPPVPDLLLYDNETGESPIIVEVCHLEGLKLDLKKVARPD